MNRNFTEDNAEMSYNLIENCCSFDFHLSNNEQSRASFHVFIRHLKCLLQRNVCWGLLPIFWFGCLFFWCWATWAAYIFWRLILCRLLHLQLYPSILRAAFFILFFAFLCCKFFLRSKTVCRWHDTIQRKP